MQAFLHYAIIFIIKSVLTQLSNNMVYIGGPKINCYGDYLDDVTKLYDTSIFEKTIAELTEEDEQKSYYFQNLKKEKDTLVQESLDM